MEIKKKAIPICTDYFYYDLFEADYIKPDKLLKKGSTKVISAMKTIKEFKKFLEENNMLEYM